MAAALLVPIKAFGQAKHRLSGELSADQRAVLARALAEGVLAARGSLEPFVVCDDDEVRAWAEAGGADVIWTPGKGLIGAVEHGVDRLAVLGYQQVVVSHADLPFAHDLDQLADFTGATLVPDRFGDGTNLLSVPTDVGFRFAYGPKSYRRHLAHARELGLDVRTVRDRRLAWDVDRPDDLHPPDDLSAPALAPPTQTVQPTP